MAVIARPNLGTALIARLRSIPEIATLVSTSAGWEDGRTTPRISSQINSKWKLPTRAIRVHRVGGSPSGEDWTLGLWYPRVDVICYGAKGHEANELIELVLAAFCPNQRTDAGFVLAGCVIGSIEPEADIYSDLEPETAYPFAWIPFRVRYRSQAA